LVPIRVNSCEEMLARDDESAGQRQVGDAGLDRRVVEHRLHVQGQEEEHREEAGQRNHLRGVGGGDSLDAQDRHRHERVDDPQLVGDKRRQEHDGAGELGDRSRCAPTHIRRLDERVDEEQHAAGDEEGSEGVEVREPGADPVALEQREGADEGNSAEGDVDE
jgi:hypothetical protein